MHAAAELQLDAVNAGTGSLVAELRQVSKVYGNFAALRNVTAGFAAGSCTMILGENGAGKSTLLRLLAGLIEPTHGSVSVFAVRAAESRERIAYMSHAPMLYDELSALENLNYFAGLQGTGWCACTGSAEMALRAVRLDPNLKRPISQYSQGMRQRAALARAIQSDPELLLLDEPFSNLDVESAQTMVALLADFRTWPLRNGGKRTVLLTTHQAHLGKPIADSVIHMRGGKIVQDPEPAA